MKVLVLTEREALVVERALRALKHDAELVDPWLRFCEPSEIQRIIARDKLFVDAAEWKGASHD